MASLRKRTISGMIWNSAQRFGTMGISFISNMVLARLLTPEDFGCIGMLAIFIALSNTFIDGGFGSALIQKKEPTQEDYSTIFYWNILLGIVIYILLYFLAPYIATFYKMPILENILRVLGVVLIINAFSIVQTNQLRKKILFRKLASVNIIATLFSVVIAVIMAYKGMGVWSLVAQQLSFSVFNALFLWVIGNWHPSRYFSVSSFKELFNFGSFMLLSSFINTFFTNINSLIIGRLFSPATMGYFTQAKRVEDATALSITNIIEQVSYPILSECQNDIQKMKGFLKTANATLLYFVAPLMLLISLLSEPIIILLFSSKWLPSAPYLQILAIQGVAICLQGVNYNALAAIGKSKVLFISTIIKRILSISLMLIGVAIGGVIGLLWGMTISTFVIVIYNMTLVSKFLNYTFIMQLKDLAPIIFVNLLSFAISLIIKNHINASMTVDSILILFSYVVSYLFFSAIFKISSLTNILKLIKDKLTR